MKLYTINATPVRSDLSEFDNAQRLQNYPQIVANILHSYDIDGFTIYQVDGYWKGEAEKSFKIEIATDESYLKMGDICSELRDMYNQDSVMLTKPDNTVEFI